MIEVISGRAYYGRFGTGSVVLVNGHPHHFSGRGATSKAAKFAAQMEEQEMSKKNAKQPETSNSLGSLCDLLYSLGERKGTINAQLKELDTEINAVEQQITDAMQAQETTIARGNRATVSLGKRKVPNVIDWDAFGQYVIRHKFIHLLQRRIAKGAYDELIEQGKKVPGVVEQEFPTLRVTKI